MTKVIINNWNKGIVNDPRITQRDYSMVLSNVDTFTKPNQLLPIPSKVSGNDKNTVADLQKFAVGKWIDEDYKLFALGTQSGNSKAKLLYKDMTDLDDDSWNQPSNGEQTGGGYTLFDLFVYYERTGSFYGARDHQYIWAYDSTSNTFTDSEEDLTSFGNIAQGLVHSKDDILYIPYDNKIAKNNNGSWTSEALTLPEEFYVTSICEYGNYLAIAGAPINKDGNSRVWLWDRDSTLTTLSESIDFGDGELLILEKVEGVLVGITKKGGSTIYVDDKIIFRYYIGGSFAKKYLELESDLFTYLLQDKQKVNNRLLFLMGGTFDGVYRVGLWAISRVADGIALVQEEKVINDTEILKGSNAILGFYKIGDCTFIAYTDISNDEQVSKTDVSGQQFSYYGATSVWETTINPSMPIADRSANKQLLGVRVHYSPLPTSAKEIKLYYRVNGGSWTEIFTDDIDNSTFTEKIKDANGSNFSTGREYEFKLEFKGDVEIAELTYSYKTIESQI